jgi:hypothetical protein
LAQKKNIKQAPKKVPATRDNKPTANNPAKRDYHLIFLWVMIIIVSIIRYRLIAVPFERDEGEYGYIGNLFLHGVAPFKDAYSMKLPGTSFMYSVIMLIFGHTNTGVHTGVVLLNAATMYFLYSAFKKIFTPFIGLATASVYGFMAIGLVFDGFAAHATHFICFYSSIALFFFADFMKTGKPLKVFLCGLMLGMAFLMKQQAVFLILFAALLLFIHQKSEKKQAFPGIIKDLFVLGAGVFIPYAIVVLIIAVTGQFSIFWLWTVEYASKYESVKSMDAIIQLFNISFGPAWDSFYLLWILGFAGVFILYFSPLTRFQKLFALLYFISSACVLSAGFYFRQHYFITILPAIGLMTGILVESVLNQIRQRMKVLNSPYISVIIFSAIVVFTIYNNREYYFSYSPRVVCNIAYWGNPFNEAQEISKYIHSNTGDTDKIAILGSEPEIYFYADRTSATGFLYTYPLVENQPYNVEMQDQMIKEIEKNKPAYLIFCNVAYSWLAQAGTPKKIFDWGNSYTHDHYSPVGFVDFFNTNDKRGWQFFWGDDIKNRTTQPESFIIVFKRNPDGKI